MAYLTDNGGALVPGVNAPGAVAAPADFGSKLIQLIKDLSPILLVILVVWLLMQDDEAESKVRVNPRWRSLPEWKATEPADSRRNQLKRLIAKEGYTKVLKRLVAMANLSANASAKADATWMQKEFGD